MALAEDGFLHTFESILDWISRKTPCRTPLAQVEGDNKWRTLIQNSTPVNVVWWAHTQIYLDPHDIPHFHMKFLIVDGTLSRHVAAEARQGHRIIQTHNLIVFLVIALPALGLFAGLITFRISRPYKKKVAHLSNLVKKVERGEPLGDYETMTKSSDD